MKVSWNDTPVRARVRHHDLAISHLHGGYSKPGQGRRSEREVSLGEIEVVARRHTQSGKASARFAMQSFRSETAVQLVQLAALARKESSIVRRPTVVQPYSREGSSGGAERERAR